MKQRVVLITRDNATATGDDESGLPGNASKYLGLTDAEGCFSLALDKFSTAHAELIGEGLVDVDAVSYTHLDVYKRQVLYLYSSAGAACLLYPDCG